MSVPGRRHKYGAQATVVDGIRFASRKEARRYQELKLREKAGEVRELRLQPVYELRAPNDHDQRGSEKKIGEYRADFDYMEWSNWGGWRAVIEDVKGYRTALYKWKRKHVEAQYGVTIREV